MGPGSESSRRHAPWAVAGQSGHPGDLADTETSPDVTGRRGPDERQRHARAAVGASSSEPAAVGRPTYGNDDQRLAAAVLAPKRRGVHARTAVDLAAAEVSHQGDVLEADLGPETAELAATIDTYDPDAAWTEVTD
jgi:Protein of unknown function (DUF2950)